MSDYVDHGRRHRAGGTDPTYPGDPILFNVDNQGGWLDVTTNDFFNESGVGNLGMHFDDETGQGILFELHDPALVARIGMAPASIVIKHNEVISLQITAGVFVSLDDASVLIELKTGGTVEVQDDGGNPIFRVDEDGDLHGKTGKSLTFDL